MRGGTGLRSGLAGQTREYPPKHCLKGDWSTGWSSPPALQQCFSEDVHTEKEIDLPRAPKIRVRERQVVEMAPGGPESNGMNRQITGYTRDNNGREVELATSLSGRYGEVGDCLQRVAC